MDPAAFVADLQRVSNELSSGAPGKVPDVRLPSAWIIEGAGQRVEVPSNRLRLALDSARRSPATWPEQRSSLLRQLEALRAEATAFAAQARSNPTTRVTASREALTTVLAGAEFRRIREQSAMSQLRRRLSEWLLEVWQRLGGGVLGRRGTAVLFAWVAVLVTLGALTTWLVRVILRPSSVRRFGLPSPASRRRSARAWARDAMNASDPREAARYAYRATVCGLEEEGAWRIDDARTPREYLRLLPPDHRRRQLVGDVTSRFEEIWFAARRATADDKAAMLARLEELGCLPAD